MRKWLKGCVLALMLMGFPACDVAVEPANSFMTGDNEDPAPQGGENPQQPIPDEGN